MYGRILGYDASPAAAAAAADAVSRLHMSSDRLMIRYHYLSMTLDGWMDGWNNKNKWM